MNFTRITARSDAAAFWRVRPGTRSLWHCVARERCSPERPPRDKAFGRSILSFAARAKTALTSAFAGLPPQSAFRSSLDAPDVRIAPLFSRPALRATNVVPPARLCEFRWETDGINIQSTRVFALPAENALRRAGAIAAGRFPCRYARTCAPAATNATLRSNARAKPSAASQLQPVISSLR